MAVPEDVSRTFCWCNKGPEEHSFHSRVGTWRYCHPDPVDSAWSDRSLFYALNQELANFFHSGPDNKYVKPLCRVCLEQTALCTVVQYIDFEWRESLSGPPGLCSQWGCVFLAGSRPLHPRARSAKRTHFPV